jgi:hypothetical protein
MMRLRATRKISKRLGQRHAVDKAGKLSKQADTFQSNAHLGRKAPLEQYLFYYLSKYDIYLGVHGVYVCTVRSFQCS